MQAEVEDIGLVGFDVERRCGDELLATIPKK